jgi:hypothetical protein
MSGFEAYLYWSLREGVGFVPAQTVEVRRRVVVAVLYMGVSWEKRFEKAWLRTVVIERVVSVVVIRRVIVVVDVARTVEVVRCDKSDGR